MRRVIVIYYSRGGNTKKMAEAIGRGIQQQGVDAEVKDVASVEADMLLNYDGIVIGSPTYYGSMAAEIKKLLDDSVKFHGRLEGKVGAAFASSANIGGGNETTILTCDATPHGMIKGDPREITTGVAINSPGDRRTNNAWV